jgi:hypothetical protein
MSPGAGLQRRPVLLAMAASTGVLGGHALDAFGLLPGVHESSAVRAEVLAPSYDVLTVVGAAALAWGVELVLRRRRPWLATAVLLAGQTALLGLPEALGHAEAGGGQGEEWGALAVAVGLQVLLAAGAVGTAVVIDVLLLRLPRLRSSVRLQALAPLIRRAPQVAHGRVVGGVRGRGPPVAVRP